MTGTKIFIEIENGMVKSAIKNDEATQIDMSLVLIELDLVRLQLLNMIQSVRETKQLT